MSRQVYATVRVALLVAISCVLTSVVHAQTETEREAKKHHKEGLQALETRDHNVAEAHFRAALNLLPRASTALNLGLVLHETGRSLEAIEVYKNLLDGKWGELPVARSQVEIYRKLSENDLATVEIELRGASHAKVFVDGIERGEAQRGKLKRIRVDAGERRIHGESETGRSPARHLVLNKSGKTSVVINIVEPRQLSPTLGAAKRGVRDAKQATNGTSEDEWFREESDSTVWVIAGVGAAAAVAAVIIWVAISSSSSTAMVPPGDIAFTEGPFPTVEALRQSRR